MICPVSHLCSRSLISHRVTKKYLYTTHLCSSTSKYKAMIPHTTGITYHEKSISAYETNSNDPLCNISTSLITPPDSTSAPFNGESINNLFDHLRSECIHRMNRFTSSHIYSLLWSLSKTKRLDSSVLFEASFALLKISKNIRIKRERRNQEGSNGKTIVSDNDTYHVPQNIPESNDLADLPLDQSNVVFTPYGNSNVGTKEPCILREGPYLTVIYKPPFWVVNVETSEDDSMTSNDIHHNMKYNEISITYNEIKRDEELHCNNKNNKYQINKLIEWLSDHKNLISKKVDPIKNITRNISKERITLMRDESNAHGILHRLDVETSGPLLLANDYSGFFLGRLLFCASKISKEYICLTHGRLDINKNIYNLKREEGSYNDDGTSIIVKERILVTKVNTSTGNTFSKACISPNGKKSVTELVPICHLSKGNREYTLVYVSLGTGRTHQIRVHLEWLGHPIIGDTVYDNNIHDDQIISGRCLLHCTRLATMITPDILELKTKNKKIEECHENDFDEEIIRKFYSDHINVFCHLPDDMRNVIKKLNLSDSSFQWQKDIYEKWINREESVSLLSFEDYKRMTKEGCTQM